VATLIFCYDFLKGQILKIKKNGPGNNNFNFVSDYWRMAHWLLQSIGYVEKQGKGGLGRY
jgi:hypothetical protein